MKHFVSVSFFLIFLLSFGCATSTKPFASGSIDTNAFSALPNGKILLAKPIVTFESAATESLLLSPHYEEQKTQTTSIVTDIAETQLNRLGLETIKPSDFMTSGLSARLTPVLSAIEENCLTLKSSYKDKSALIPYLNDLEQITGAGVLCLQTIRVKVGRGSTYDPNSGAMSQSTHSSTINLTFISLNDGSIINSSSSFARCLPSDDKFKNAINMLFNKS